MEKLCIQRSPRKSRRRKVVITQDELRKNRDRMSVNYMAQYYGVSRATMYRILREAALIGKQ